jgi:2-polyprenyl-3-methyl-5-hydroxy-6-metoxy-1,4-benzoquinol methylase
MPVLDLGREFPLKPFDTEVSPNDIMFDSSKHYTKVGLSALKLIDYAAAKGFTRTGGLRAILDLPCGHGRVTRCLRSQFPDVDLTVCDINRDGVDFCARKFKATGVYGTNDFERMELERSFDLIWVGSLITHFCADQTMKFIRCMMNHLSSDGLLILTTLQGKASLRRTALSKLRSGYLKSKIPGKSIFNMTQDCCTKYNTLSNMYAQFRTVGYGYEDDPRSPGTGYGHSIISRHWMEGFFAGEAYGTVDYLECGWDDYQDVIFVKKKDRAS